MKYLVTGVAGFIGSNVAKSLLASGHHVVGIDNMNEYYDVALKKYRLTYFTGKSNFTFVEINIADRHAVQELFAFEQFDIVVHLAAQAGVRHSIKAPFDYVDSNLVGMLTILEGCRHNSVQHLVYASSSSVYGANQKIPFCETDRVDEPVSLYAATKKSNELMAYSYSSLYGIPSTALRFFTVYGPAGRPDMAPWLFTEAILQGKPIKIFNHGNMIRDFTYIDDIVEGVIRVSNLVPSGAVPHALFNIGNNAPVKLGYFIEVLESACGVAAIKEYTGMQDGDVPATYADITALENVVGYQPKTNIEVGLGKFVNWYRNSWSTKIKNC